MLKLGTIITDNVTGIKGSLTMYIVSSGQNKHYLFQPGALNPKDQQPVTTFWLTEDRIAGGENIDVKLPLEILGTIVEDKVTGFKGTAILLEYHQNGCVHIEVKPKGILKETGESIKACSFDVRRLKGKAIKELTEKELEQSKIEKPSPEYKPELYRS